MVIKVNKVSFSKDFTHITGGWEVFFLTCFKLNNIKRWLSVGVNGVLV